MEKLASNALQQSSSCKAVEIKDKYASNKVHYICHAHTLAMAGNDRNLEEFPSDTILSLNKLSILKMYNNNITYLPNEIFQQFSTTLTVINFSLNKLEEMPRGMESLSNIREIFLALNKIASIPEGILSAFSKTLIHFDLSSNCIRKLPHDIGKLAALKYLNLSYNPLEELCEDIGNLESLEGLLLNGHNLTHLPPTFSSLKNLKKLSLSGVPWISITSQDYLHNKMITKETIVDLLIHPSDHVAVNAFTKQVK